MHHDPMNDSTREILDAVEDICRRYRIAALDPFVAACRDFAEEECLSVAVLGRFKAGKSSFLNHLLSRDVLPVGVTPVTSVVTELQWGPQEIAEITFQDGHSQRTSIAEAGEFIAEAENPANRKGVARVRLETPSLDGYRGARFVDTPGLESAFGHNSEVSRGWLPNTGLALVAIAADSPLSQQDLELIADLRHFTPNISLLLTKADRLTDAELAEVRSFVDSQLASGPGLTVFPYSVRPGFEHLRRQLEESLLDPMCADLTGRRAAILRHKLDALLVECAGYLNVALRAAQAADADRDQLRRGILGQASVVEDARLSLKLIVRHAVSGTRRALESTVMAEEAVLTRRLQDDLRKQFPTWAASLAESRRGFQEWADSCIAREIAALSQRHRQRFCEPVDECGRRLAQSLQDFRNRVSERTLETLGMSLPTTEMEIRVPQPRSPDIYVGRIFDRNWEMLSWLIPMFLVKNAVRKHYQRRTADLAFTNLSRLVSQWEEVVSAALDSMEKEAASRLDDLVSTIVKLTGVASEEVPRIESDLRVVTSFFHHEGTKEDKTKDTK
jgi:GTP-binding protein EngB required for normal cell division